MNRFRLVGLVGVGLTLFALLNQPSFDPSYVAVVLVAFASTWLLGGVVERVRRNLGNWSALLTGPASAMGVLTATVVGGALANLPSLINDTPPPMYMSGGLFVVWGVGLVPAAAAGLVCGLVVVLTSAMAPQEA